MQLYYTTYGVTYELMSHKGETGWPDGLALEREAALADFMIQSTRDSPTHTPAQIRVWWEFDGEGHAGPSRMGKIVGVWDGGDDIDAGEIDWIIDNVAANFPEGATTLFKITGGEKMVDPSIKSLLDTINSTPWELPYHMEKIITSPVRGKEIK